MKPIFVTGRRDYERYQKQLVAQKITTDDDLDAKPAIEYKTDDPLRRLVDILKFID